jgi:hypothetical protein
VIGQKEIAGHERLRRVEERKAVGKGAAIGFVRDRCVNGGAPHLIEGVEKRRAQFEGMALSDLERLSERHAIGEVPRADDVIAFGSPTSARRESTSGLPRKSLLVSATLAVAPACWMLPGSLSN